MSINHRYRLLVKFDTRQSRWVNALTKKEFKFPSGVDLDIEIAISKNQTILEFWDIQNLTDAELVIKSYDGTPPSPTDPAVTTPIAGVINDPDLTIEDWESGASQHITFSLTAAESNLPAGNYWISISGATATETLAIAWGDFEVEEDGTGPVTTVTPITLGYNATSIRGVGIDETADTPTDGVILVYRTAGDDWVLESKPAGGAGGGDVVGPVSATDNAIVRFDLTTGKLVQDSSATLSDSGIITTARADFNNAGIQADATKIGNVSNQLLLYANNGGAEIETSNDTRIRFNNQVRLDSNNFDINTPPIVLRNVEEDDSPGSKGSIIEWQQNFTLGDKTVGIATQAYWDWIKGGSVGPRPTFNVASTGIKRVCWVMSHYDSPATTGEDIHQHFNIETCQADLTTIITRFQISYGEDIALVSFPNSNLQIFDDRRLYLSSNNSVYFAYNSAEQELRLYSDLTKIGDNTSDVLLELAGQNNSSTGGTIRFSENSGTPKNGVSLVYNSTENRLELRNDLTASNVALFFRDGGINLLTNRLIDVGEPIALQDAATKNYVDTAVSGLSGDATSIQGTNVDASVGTPNDGDILVYRSAGSDFVLEAKPAGGSNPAWGDITGTLASQTDLQSALDAKIETNGTAVLNNISLNAEGAFEIRAHSTEPGNPAANGLMLYVKTGQLYSKESSNVKNLSALIDSAYQANDDAVFNSVELGTNGTFVIGNYATASPPTPAAGTVVIYSKNGTDLFVKDDTGTITDLLAGGGSNATSIQGTNVDASVGTPSDGDILVYRSAGSDFVLETKPAGGGDVTAAANMADNAIVRGDGGAKGVQETNWLIDDTDQMYNNPDIPSQWALNIGGGLDANIGIFTTQTAGVGMSVHQGRGTLASPTASQSGDVLLFNGGRGYGTTGYGSGSKGVFLIVATQNWTDANQGTAAVIETTPDGSTTRSEVARFTNTQFTAGNFVFNIDQTVGAGQDNYVLTYDNGTGEIGLEALTGGGDALTSNPLSQFAATTSAQLLAVISDETGTGALVFATSPTFTTGITVNGTITVTGTVDGRDIATDGTKLDGIESGATADQTGAEIKTAYESEADTNAFTDAEQTKLAAISGTNTGDEVAASTTVAGISELATSAEIDTGTDNTRTITPVGLAGSALQTKVDGIESGATADQTGTEIVSAVDTELGQSTWKTQATRALLNIDTTDSVVFGNLELGADGAVTLDEHSTAAGTPAAGKVAIYAKADGKLYIKDDTGTETDLTSTGSGSLGSNLASTTDDITSNNGTIRLAGSGGTNNEDLDFDFETTANTVGVSSSTGVATIDFGTIEVDAPNVVKRGEVEEIWIDAAAMVPRTTNGAEAATEELATNDVMIDHYLFDSVTEEGVQFKFVFPRSWDKGTIQAKFYWDGATGATASDGVTWGIAAQARSNDDALDNAFPASVDTDDALLAVGDTHITAASAAVTISGTPADDDLILFEITRVVGDANDNMAEDAKLLGVYIQFTKSSTAPSAF